MPRTLRIAEPALADLVRLRSFLASKNAVAAERAGEVIARALRSITEQPERGRPVEFFPGARELLIGYGSTGYVALYAVTEKEVVVLALRHQREAGYRE